MSKFSKAKVGARPEEVVKESDEARFVVVCWTACTVQYVRTDHVRHFRVSCRSQGTLPPVRDWINSTKAGVVLVLGGMYGVTCNLLPVLVWLGFGSVASAD